jgi:polyferredoxin
MQQDTELYRDTLATVGKDGNRIWLFPKQPKGRFYDARTVVSVLFLLVFLILPFIKVGGEPILLFNVLERRFILFGLLFSPHDFPLFLLAMLTFIVFIILFTVVFGRLFCGWVCPQTVFMEMIFRRIEYWIEGDGTAQRRLDAAPWSADKLKKRVLKHSIFFVMSVVVANYFLAYIIGMDAVLTIISQPVWQNIGGFVAMLVFSIVFYGVFARLREQVCTTICPYGRLQSVLLVPDSIVVAYDFMRGEPRGKLKKQTEPLRKEPCKNGCPDCADCAATSNLLKNIEDSVKAAATSTPSVFLLNDKIGVETSDISNTVHRTSNIVHPTLGDCIDCKLCVQVCPTGIDIRNGTQLECTNCTACIDACDEVMIKIKKPKGLIRYDSLNGIKSGKRKLFTGRVAAYSVVLILLLSLDIGLLTNRADIAVTILRSPGTMYQIVDDQHFTNLYTFQIINKTRHDLPLSFNMENGIGHIKVIGDEHPTLHAGDMHDGVFFIELDAAHIDGLKTTLGIEIWSGKKFLKLVKTSFVGPMR